MSTIAAVDPGTEKCGMAVLSRAGDVMERAVIDRSTAAQRLVAWIERYGIGAVVVGDRTGSKAFVAELESVGIPGGGVDLHLVDEHMSSVEARERYFRENPPTGWRRLIPISMQTPRQPFDDYVAVILGERYLRSQQAP